MEMARERRIYQASIDMDEHTEKCARTACDRTQQGWEHTDTGLLYCTSCAFKINDAAGKKIVIKRTN